MRKYAFHWWGGFNLSPLILYPLRAHIAVSEDDTCDLAKPLNEKTNVSFFFVHFRFSIYTAIYERQKYWGGGRRPCPPPPPLFRRPCGFKSWGLHCMSLSVICYHITNEEVRRKIQAAIGDYDELLTTVKKRKLRWFGHVSRSSGLAKTILQGTVICCCCCIVVLRPR